MWDCSGCLLPLPLLFPSCSAEQYTDSRFNIVAALSLSLFLPSRKLAQPSILFRAFIIAAQGVFYNLFFLSYMISPKTCHRFVGVLEEEAVVTYTLAIKEIEEGRLPEWKDMPAPQIAIDYWRMKQDATLLDVIYAVRSDEAGHRFANHTFANVKDQDFNPMALRQPDGRIQGTQPGFSREEGREWYEATSAELLRGREKALEQEEEKKSA